MLLGRKYDAAGEDGMFLLSGLFNFFSADQIIMPITLGQHYNNKARVKNSITRAALSHRCHFSIHDMVIKRAVNQ